MKKILSLFVIVLITFTIGCKKDKSLNQTRFITAKGGLRMRANPNLKDKKIGIVSEGTEVLLLEEKGEDIKIGSRTGKWSRVKWGEKTGWVFGGFLSEQKMLSSPMKIQFKGIGLTLLKNGGIVLTNKKENIISTGECETKFLRGKWSKENSDKIEIDYFYIYYGDCPGLREGVREEEEGHETYDIKKKKLS